MLSSPDWKLTLVTNHQVSLRCPTTKSPPTTKYLCGAQPMSIPVMLPACAQPQNIPAKPNHQVSLRCPTTKYPCSAQPMTTAVILNGCAQPQNIPAVPHCRVSLQCPTTKYPRRIQLKSIPTVPAQQHSINILAAHVQCCKEAS